MLLTLNVPPPAVTCLYLSFQTISATLVKISYAHHRPHAQRSRRRILDVNLGTFYVSSFQAQLVHHSTRTDLVVCGDLCLRLSKTQIYWSACGRLVVAISLYLDYLSHL